MVVQLNSQILQGCASTHLRRGGKILLLLLLQFILECNSERIIKIGPKLVHKVCAGVLF